MSISTMPIRRIFSSLAASAVLCGIATQANAEIKLEESALPDHCVSFDARQTRNKYMYDIPLFLILERLNVYSGWSSILAKAKLLNIPFDGLCPDLTAIRPFELKTENSGVAISIAEPETNNRIAPRYLADKIFTDQYPIAGMIAGNISGIVSQLNGERLFNEDDTMNAHLVLMTALRATMLSEQILLGAEASAYYRQNGEIELSLKRHPQLKNEIFVLMFQSSAAATEKRFLTETEKTAFRQAVYTALLKDVELRTDLLKLWTKDHDNDMDIKAEKGLPVKAPNSQKFIFEEVQDRLARFPGHLAGTEFLRTEYEAHWQDRPKEDIARSMLQFLQIKADMINNARKNAAVTRAPSP